MILGQSWRSLETYSEYGLGVLNLIEVLPQSLSPEYIVSRVFGVLAIFRVLDVFGVLCELEFGSISVVNSNSVDLLCLTPPQLL